jgi:3-hydroxyacyl-[acyl-carrier-protein] dehydratase
MEVTVRDIDAVMAALPHRFPFLLVDRILEVSPDGKRAVALKNVTINEPFFAGHFPEYPIMPGVLIVEALAQAASAALLTPELRQGRLGMLGGVDGFRFRRPVRPGDQLRLEVELVKMRGPVGRISGRATVDGEVAAEGEITFALADVAALKQPGK